MLTVFFTVFLTALVLTQGISAWWTRGWRNYDWLLIGAMACVGVCWFAILTGK